MMQQAFTFVFLDKVHIISFVVLDLSIRGAKLKFLFFDNFDILTEQ